MARPDDVAWVFPQDVRELSNAALLSEVRRLAAGLARFCEPGDRLAIQLPQGADYVLVFWACIYAGVIAVPLYPGSKRDVKARLSATIADCGAKYTMVAQAVDPSHLTVRDLQGSADTVTEPSSAHSGLAYIQYSSGSTGAPKGVMISHDNILANVTMIAELAAVTSDDVFISWLPLHHDLGLVNTVLLPAFMGCRSVISTPLSFMRNPQSWLGLMTQYRGTVSGAPNFAYQMCVDRMRTGALEGLDLRAWRVAFNAAEPVQVETLRAFAQAYEPAGFRRESFFAAYGMAEATVFVSGAFWNQSQETTNAQGDNGGVVAHTINCGTVPPDDLVVVDESRQVCADGQRGEIWIRGRHVSAGYFGTDQGEASPFAVFTADGRGPFFKTGDNGAILGGRLYVLGRIKEIIIQNGRNLYPTDLEHVAHNVLAGDKRFGVVAVIGKAWKGTEVPLAVVELRDASDANGAEDLRRVAGAVFDALDVVLYDVLTVPAGSIQRTSSGKIKRGELRRMLEEGLVEGRSQMELGATGTPDANTAYAFEPRLIELVQTLANEEVIDPNRSLLSYGLSSLQLSQLAVEAETISGVALAARDIFETPTVRHIARLIQARLSKDVVTATPAAPIGLTCNQQMMLSVDVLSPGHRGYILPLALRLSGDLDQARLAAAMRQVVARHDILRTIYPLTIEGVHSSAVLETALEISQETVPEASISAAVCAFASRAFDLAADIPVRAKIFSLDESRDIVLALVIHHIAADGWSLHLLARDIVKACLSLAEAGPCVRFDPPQIDQNVVTSSLDYWRAHLAGLPSVHSLPVDAPRQSHREKNGRRYDLVLPPREVNALKGLCAAEGATLFSGLHALFALALARAGNEPDIVLGTFLSGRDRSGDTVRIGFLAETTLLRTRVDLGRSLRDVIRSCHGVLQEARRHPGVSYMDLLRELKPAREATHNPLFQVTLNLHDYAFDCLTEQEAGKKINAKRLPVDLGVTRFDLGLDVYAEADAMRLSLEYDVDLFEEASIHRLADYMYELLQAGLAQPTIPTGLLRAGGLLSFPEAVTERSWSNLYDAFDRVAREKHEAPAIRFAGQTWTYGMLGEEVARIAEGLREGVRAGDRVIIFMRRSPAYIASLLAILSLDCTYVPIDPDFYQDSIGAKIRHISPAFVLVDGHTAEMVEDLSNSVKLVNVADLSHPASLSVPPDRGAQHAAYILFTSGSTGEPKAVSMGHIPLLNLIDQIASTADLSSPVVLNYSSIAFDMHFTEVFSALLLGGVVVLADEATRLDSLGLLRLVAEEGVTLLNLSYPVLCELASASNQSRIELTSVNTVFSTAQQLKITPVLRSFFQRHGRARLYNHYGPTETHVVTIAALKGPSEAWPDIPDIGQAIGGCHCFVINASGTPEPQGMVGELCVAGLPLAEGYYANPTMTASRFISISDASGKPVRAYRTGDFARRALDERWQYLGRKDHQLKIRGLRVDLPDIEASILQCTGVLQAAVVAREVGQGHRLVAYVQPADMDATAAEALPVLIEDTLRRSLASYMIPDIYILVERFDLNQNGKIDVSRLPAAAFGDEVSFEGPANAEEAFLYSVWRRVLGHDQFGRRTNFFEAGGDSMALMSVKRELDLQFGFEVDLVAVYGSPTIADLASIGSRQSDDRDWRGPRRKNLNILRRQRAVPQRQSGG
ncbi:AMP-binding protein [Asticcacaulis sp. MM231]|uniref:AMP-binding protein n=1 Tax=Asticcacaulis sp. MM231 TaxID=3157666 RepID=UPI0032D58B4A